jgi:hypothetical protein
MPLKLYEISAAIEQALTFDAETGELCPESFDRLNALTLERSQKASDIACLIKSLEAERSALQGEMQTLEGRSVALEHRSDWLRAYLAQWLPDGERIEDARVRLLVKSTTAVEFPWDLDGVEKPDLAMIGWPEDCLKIRTTVSPVKTRIRERIEAGETVPEATIVARKHVVIR